MTEWAGLERRINTMSELAGIKTDIAVIKTTVVVMDKRINGSIEDIEKHMERGTSWRIAIAGTIVGLIIQIVFFAYLFGNINRQVCVNTERLDRIENR